MDVLEEDVVEFGPFRLEPGRRRLTRGGELVRIGDRALDVLIVLAAHAPEIVSKNALMDRVWAGLRVEDSNLRFQIIALRKALGGRDYISTVQGRGYCLVTPVRQPAEAVPAQPSLPDPAGLPATNLRQPLTPIVGRRNVLAELRDCFERQRLVTLVGPGGIGKTRLAVAFGNQFLRDFPGGVWLVDLAPLTDPASVAKATAMVLRAPVPPAEAAIDPIVSALGRQRSLLILDNCEHLAAAAAEFTKALLERVPALAVLATSQRALKIPAEQLYLLPPLALPPEGAAEIEGYGAADLFVERARAADRSFAPDRQNMAGIVDICRRLDGLPLALEMAAARVRMLGVEGLRHALDHRLKFLRGAEHLVEQRHASLRATVEWSYGLLDDQERHLFSSLAIFPASFSLEAAIAVGSDRAVERWALVDTLGRLVDKSLVVIESWEHRRYRLLETLRLYADEMLRKANAWDVVAERHARYVIQNLQRMESEEENTPTAELLARHQLELDNVVAALNWALAEPGRAPIALALGGLGIDALCQLRLLADGRQYFERLVRLIGDDTPPAVEASIRTRVKSLWPNATDQMVLDHLQRAALLFRAVGDQPQLSMALAAIGIHHGMRQQFDDALAMLKEAEELAAHSDRRRLHLVILMARASVSSLAGLLEEGRNQYRRALPLARALKSVNEISCLANLARLEYVTGNLKAAADRGRQAVDRIRVTPGQPYFGLGLCNLVVFLLALERWAEARGFAEEAFPHFAQADTIALNFFEMWAALGAQEGRVEAAARLSGFIDAERARSNQLLSATDQWLRDLLSNRLEAGLSTEDRRAYKAEGADWTDTEALALVEAQLLPPPSPR